MKTSDTFQEDARYRVLRLIQDQPKISQRQMAKELGISLGGVNYCLKGLIEKGLVKIKNVRESDDRRKYAYLLTPKGVGEKAGLTARFLSRRMREYEALQAEIEAMTAEREG